jgi:hypothetical protein
MSKLSALLTPLPCAVLLCLANAFKPAVIDDLAYVWYARQITQTPAEPFGPPPDGFRLIWYDRTQGAFTLLTPMVVPYWLAVGLALFGENLVLLKLWLFPFCLLFTASTFALFRRFAPGFEKPLLALTTFSPVFLPSLNLMIDVPAAALGLAALALLIHAVDREYPNWSQILAAGALAGIAAQTKYTGFTASAVILLFAILRRRALSGMVAVLVAASIFVAWEAYLAHVYGRSHFLMQVERQQERFQDLNGGFVARISGITQQKALMIVPLVGVLGGIASALIPLLLLGLRARVAIVRATLMFVMFCFVLMAVLPESVALFYRDSRNARNEVSLSTIVAGASGILFVFVLVAAVAYLGFRGWSRWRIRLRTDAKAWFLIGWLVIELVACFALSPFIAVRRVLGIYIASTLVAGRLLAANAHEGMRWRLAMWSVCFGIALGVVTALTDCRDAAVEKRAMQESITWIREQPGGEGPIWFCGHWGFHYYGEQAGLRAVCPGESLLQPGDWIIYPDTALRPYGQLVALDPHRAEETLVIEWFDSWPLRTNPDFYDGYQPIRHHESHRLRVSIFRVKKEFVAQSP